MPGLSNQTTKIIICKETTNSGRNNYYWYKRAFRSSIANKRCKKQPDFTPFIIFVANGVKNRVFYHRFSMALYFHDQCQNDSKTQHVLSGKWWVFTDKWSVTHFCPGKGRFLRTKVYVFEPGFPPDPFSSPWPILRCPRQTPDAILR